jgi:hypothetical protein
MGLLSLLGRIGDFAAFLSGEFIIISNGNQQGTGQVQQAQIQFPALSPPAPPLALSYQAMPSYQGLPYQLGFNEFYHGTSEDAALKVFNEKYWVFGNLQRPLAIWMTTQLGTAQSYANNHHDGKILVLKINPHIPLTDQGSGIYTFEVPKAKPNTEYDISGFVEPVALLDKHGHQIQ